MTRLTLCAAVMVSACGGAPPGASDGGVLNGNERFGWDQPAVDRAELASFRYAMYVDGARSEAEDVTCGTTRTTGGFACSCRLPRLAQGSHTLQVAAYIMDGATVRESSRSAPVRVTAR